MEKQISSQRAKSIELRFRCQAKKISQQGYLFDFLQNDEVSTCKEMILQAIKAYWMPIAMTKTNQFSEEQLEFAGLRAIQELKRQMIEIAISVGLDLDEIYLHSSQKETELVEPPLKTNQEISFTETSPFTDFGL